MNWTALIETVLLCLISIVIEGVSATKEGKQWFENLNQPKYSFSLSVWYLIGGLYYIIFGMIAYRLFTDTKVVFSIPIIVLVLLMIINGLSNFILFRFRSLKGFYWILFPFTALFISFFLILLNNDRASVGLASIYLIWLPYDFYYLYNLWKLNQ
jgi:tryptophan-rich sensory protein